MNKKNKGKIIYITILAIIIIAFLIVSFVFPQTGEAIFNLFKKDYYTYNNYEFHYVNGLWITEIYDQFTQTVYRVPMHYGPKELEDIEVNGNVNLILKEISQFRGPNNKPTVFVTYDPEENTSKLTLAYFELHQNIGTTFGIDLLPTITHDIDTVENATIVTCESTSKPVIYLKMGSPESVSYEKGCVIIQGQDEGIIKSVDRFLLNIYGVMS